MQLQMSKSSHDLLSKAENLDQLNSFPESSDEIALLRVSVDPNPNPNPKQEEEEEDPKFKLQKKLSDSIFYQHIALMAIIDHTLFYL